MSEEVAKSRQSLVVDAEVVHPIRALLDEAKRQGSGRLLLALERQSRVPEPVNKNETLGS